MRFVLRGFPGRFRSRFGPRIAGIVLALLIEALLVLMLLTLAPSITPPREAVDMTVFDFAPDAELKPEKAPAPTAHTPPQPAERTEVQPPEPPATTPRPIPSPVVRLPPAFIPLSRDQMDAGDIAAIPARTAPLVAGRGRVAGPPDPGPSPGDTPRVEGTGPQGQPLYAAAWYREPYDDELRGYLSTARGPGWGLIACRTAPDFRVEDCVSLGEYPDGSGIARAVLAAAWQFRVRPPRIGGQSQVGEWVRIRIDYEMRRR